MNKINSEQPMSGIEPNQNLLIQSTKSVYRQTGLKLIPTEENVNVEGYTHLHFTPKIKKWAQQANLGALINEVQQLPEKGMLVADYVNTKMADKLRQMNIPFIDTAGNVFINEKPLYLFVKGNKYKPENGTSKQTKEAQTGGRAFMPSGIKMLYAIMREPDLINESYRKIASKADVSLGTVGFVFKDLKRANYLLDFEGQPRRLINKEKLLTKWVDAYLEKLRPSLFLGTFRAENNDWWMELGEKIMDYDACWGGEVAAAKITRHLKPEEITIYSKDTLRKQLFSDNRFSKDPKGKIKVFQTFWNTKGKNSAQFMDLVEPIIIYADLLATGDARNLETARILYDTEIVKFIEEN